MSVAGSELVRDAPLRAAPTTPQMRERLTRLGPYLLVAVAAFSLRAVNLSQSWEVHVDEVTYLRIAQNVAEQLQVELYGNPFFLHPPAYFFLEAGFLRLLPAPDALIPAIVHVRYLNLVFATATAVAVFVIVRQLTRPLTGLLAALAFSLEPFIIKMNSINLLDTSAMLWMALGYAWLLTHRGPGSLPRWRVAAAGVSFALACLTKEMTVFPIVLSLFAAVVLRAGLRIRDVATILGVMVLVYVPYPVIAALSGHWEAFTASKSDGVLRFLGSVKISGFERGGDGPSFVAAVLENLDELATTYALIGVGLPAAAVLAWWGDTRKRLLGVWCAASFVLLAYGVGLGTLEEQFFYLLVVPALVATVVAADLVLERTRHRSAHRPAVVLVALAVIGSFAWAEATWRAVHFTSDNGYERLLAFLRDESTPDAPIAVTMETAKFLLVGYDRGAWNSPRELEANRARYVLLSTYEMDHGYGYASRDFYRWVAGRSELVFSFRRARNDDLLLLFRLPRTAAPQRARAQAGAITPRRP